MKLFLHNTLSRQKEIFLPIDESLVKLYVCGPTVYDAPHIGNARSVIIYDILYRILNLIYGKEHVLYVRNITDIDDKIILRSQQLGIPITDLTMQVTKIFHDNMEYLGCLPPTIEPKATEHIPEMTLIIKKLFEQDSAYIADHHVYFDVSKAQNYSQLSNQNLEEIEDGNRITNSSFKRNPQDFILWKPAKESDKSSFDSPFGSGRPGWHIECSAMSHKYLGENFDIHGGGSDLIFPHHTNEIAQSRCAFKGSIYAKYWVHNGFVTCAGEKMSKSEGNFITVNDLIGTGVKGDVIRLALLTSHYRKPLDYGNKLLSDAAKLLDYWYRAIENLDSHIYEPLIPQDEFLSALLDDLNIPLSIKIINDYAKEIFVATSRSEKSHKARIVISSARLIGLMSLDADEWFANRLDLKVIELIDARTTAKQEKNWLLADSVRNELLNMGIILEDRPDGSTIVRKANI